ncbi:sensor histidine kinase [Chryseobacterium paridis]|uniref:Histidine kinase n=1 Tax=Chryseobacterium paridis TaxID=2800328 RepID=A0ABS1FUW0_9FLAO|nr:histidine kinase [Chryseobacterium paridis]MBK1896216.1 histidine kinase [Chryseobacterium paridis]
MKENFNLIFKEKQVKDDFLLRFLVDGKYRIIRHLLSFSCILFFMTAGRRWGEFDGIYDHLDWIFNVSLLSLLFYFNMYILIPKFLYKGKSINYLIILCFSVLIGCSFLLIHRKVLLESHRLLPAINIKNSLLEVLVVTCFLIPIILFSSGLKLFQHWMADIEKFYELKKKSAESELIALRNQIQPHFLFNMLNNINILTRRDPKKASYIILKLSDFLRRLLYEDNENEVYISSEIKFMDDYLSLEKIRRDNFEYTIKYCEDQIRDVKIPPNIFLILIENAIKHSMDSSDGSYIDAVLLIENGFLKVHVVNSVPTVSITKNKESGVGLNNMQRRLELIYKDTYSLKSSRTKDEYMTTLKLPL